MKQVLCACLGAFAMIVATPTIARCDPPVRLAYRAGGPFEFWIRTTIAKTHSRGPGAPEVDTVDVLSLIGQTYSATATGPLEVKLEPKQRQAWANGEEAADGELPLLPSHGQLMPDGTVPGEARDTIDAAMDPVFPEAPVTPGHSWSAEIPANAQLPVPLKIVHKFEKIERINGSRCAVVSSSGTAKGKLPDGSGAFAAKLESSTALSLDDGQTVRGRSELRLLVKRPASAKHPETRQSTTRVVRSIARKSTADPAPPGPPEKPW
jgi:hypothetical protein